LAQLNNKAIEQRIRDVLDSLEQIAPSRYAFGFDKVGLQVGDLNAPVTRAAVSLDRSLGAIDFARRNGCQLLLAHHPMIFTPIQSVDSRTHIGRSILELAKNGIAFIAAHTNWDSAQGGINDCLAEILGVGDLRAFGGAAEVDRLKLVFFCPPDSVERVVDAASEAGAGVVGAYRRCAFSHAGLGTFIGDETTHPSIGVPGSRQEVDETRVEMTLLSGRRRSVEKAILKAHPYEEPAYDFLVASAVYEQPAGRVGKLSEPRTLSELTALVDARLETRSLAWGDGAKKLTKVAIVGGAADSEWVAAQREGADVLITGEVKQHVAVEATESGMTLIAAGHYATEHPGCGALRDRMAQAMPEIEWLLFTPEAGFHGRPF
jgi:dinuclear metal center YbgI/SA1388 family protein